MIAFTQNSYGYTADPVGVMGGNPNGRAWDVLGLEAHDLKRLAERVEENPEGAAQYLRDLQTRFLPKRDLS